MASDSGNSEPDVLKHSVGEFDVGGLPTDILEGVMQRSRGKAKGQLELVNQRFAIVAHRLAWRHHHTLTVLLRSPFTGQLRIAVGSYITDVADTASATRFLVTRSTIHNVGFYVGFYQGGNLQLRQEQCQAILAALLASERVALRSLLLHHLYCSTVDVFSSSEQVVALIQRHSATLEEASLSFHLDDPQTAVNVALAACPSMRKLTAFINSQDGDDSWQPSLGQLTQRLQLTSLTISGWYFGKYCVPHSLDVAAVLPLAPMLTELRFERFAVALDAERDLSALANLRLLQAEVKCLSLSDSCTQEETNRVFAAVLPNLEVLIVDRALSTSVYWKVLKKMVKAFLNRAGDGSLTVGLGIYEDCGYAWWHPLTKWRAFFCPKLSLEYFGAQTDGQAAEGDKKRPKLPKELKHAADSEVFVLGRPNETRRITLALWHMKG